MIIVKAKFIGRDGSLGYRTGMVYEIEIMTNSQRVHPRQHRAGTSLLAVRRLRTLWQRFTCQYDGYCPYDSEKLFNQNWEIIEGIGAPKWKF